METETRPEILYHFRPLETPKVSFCGAKITSQDFIANGPITRKLKARDIATKYMRMSDGIMFDACPTCLHSVIAS